MSVIAWAVGAALVAFSCWKLLKISGLLQPYMSPLGDIPGPPSPSFLYGNMHEIQNSEASIVREQWVDMYGPTLKYKGWLNVISCSCLPVQTYVESCVSRSIGYTRSTPVQSTMCSLIRTIIQRWSYPAIF